MDDKQLRNFLLVAQEHSFTKAAALAFLSVPSLKLQMDRLESEVQTKLFIRSNKGVSLTEDGEIFFSYAQKTISELDSTLSVFQASSTPESNLIYIGYNTSQIHDSNYYKVFQDFITQFPSAKIELQKVSFFDLSVFDLFLGHVTSLPPNVHKIKLCDMPLYGIVRADCIDTKKENLSLEDLAQMHVRIPLAELVSLIRPNLLSALDAQLIRYSFQTKEDANIVFQSLEKGTINLIVGREPSLPESLMQLPIKDFCFPYYIYISPRALHRPLIKNYLDALVTFYKNPNN